MVVIKCRIHWLSGREVDGGESFFKYIYIYIQGHESIKMASGSVVERPPSSLPSGKKLFGSVIPPLKKEHWRIKITWERKICVRSMACPLVRAAWHCGNRGTYIDKASLMCTTLIHSLTCLL
jgi:hypothetical protein